MLLIGECNARWYEMFKDPIFWTPLGQKVKKILSFQNYRKLANCRKVKEVKMQKLLLHRWRMCPSLCLVRRQNLTVKAAEQLKKVSVSIVSSGFHLNPFNGFKMSSTLTSWNVVVIFAHLWIKAPFVFFFFFYDCICYTSDLIMSASVSPQCYSHCKSGYPTRGQ